MAASQLIQTRGSGAARKRQEEADERRSFDSSRRGAGAQFRKAIEESGSARRARPEPHRRPRRDQHPLLGARRRRHAPRAGQRRPRRLEARLGARRHLRRAVARARAPPSVAAPAAAAARSPSGAAPRHARGGRRGGCATGRRARPSGTRLAHRGAAEDERLERQQPRVGAPVDLEPALEPARRRRGSSPAAASRAARPRRAPAASRCAPRRRRSGRPARPPGWSRPAPAPGTGLEPPVEAVAAGDPAGGVDEHRLGHGAVRRGRSALAQPCWYSRSSRMRRLAQRDRDLGAAAGALQVGRERESTHLGSKAVGPADATGAQSAAAQALPIARAAPASRPGDNFTD